MRLKLFLIGLALLLSGCALTPMEIAAERARTELQFMPDNCLYVAALTKRYLGDTTAKLVVIDQPGPVDHAILCDDNGTCVDNGYISSRAFPLEHALEYGRIRS